ncbi:Spherulation-specific family 4-domain-containing protein [Mycena epipterygia]|nr:Spherulation-specific family 4-domain-containing protein [Mycena epipterygia]
MLSCCVLAVLWFAFALPLCVQGLGVLLPLYLKPDSNCATWQSLFKIISAHPNTAFYTIINPDNGPGVNGSQPRSGYQACVASLRPSGNPQAIVLRYVDTASPTTVLTDIDTYAGWNSSYQPTGIFFDHVAATADVVDTYGAYVSHAKSQGFMFTAFDARGPADALSSCGSYQHVRGYSSFDASTLSNTDSTPLSKQSVTLIDATGSYSSIITQLANLGVAAVYITNAALSGAALPSGFSTYVDEIANEPDTVSAPPTSHGSLSTSISSTFRPSSSSSSSLPATTSSSLPSNKVCSPQH